MPRHWPKDWNPLTEQHFHLEWGRMHNELGCGEEIAGSLELELVREVSQGHPLYGKKTTAIGGLRNCPNDFLYSLDDGPYAWVHLTWRREHDARFPRCELYADWDDVLANAPVSG
jgi:hypothetical protein